MTGTVLLGAQTCVSCRPGLGRVHRTFYSGTLTLRVGHAGSSGTAAVAEMKTASRRKRTVTESAPIMVR